jgi:hypothetical protein
MITGCVPAISLILSEEGKNQMNLTPAQNALLSRLEEQCKAKDNPVWVGTWADMLKLGGSRDLLNGLEQGSYIAPYMQKGDYWTVMPTRKEGLQRLAIQARFETYARHESDEFNGDDPVWNEDDQAAVEAPGEPYTDDGLYL